MYHGNNIYMTCYSLDLKVKYFHSRCLPHLLTLTRHYHTHSHTSLLDISTTPGAPPSSLVPLLVTGL